MSDLDLAVRFFLQLAVILTACRIVGWLGKFVGQTQVVSEMIAGVMLGPSLFGLLLPQTHAWLFPKTTAAGTTHPSMSILYVVSQLGLVLYMFLVGLEFNTKLLRTRARSAAAVSISGIALPFVLGAGASLVLHNRGDLFQSNVSPTLGAIFMGAAMCITAFPMLARILYEQRIASTALGTLTLAAGAIDDAMAWCMLAIVLAFFKGDPNIAFLAIAGGAALPIFLGLIGRHAMAKLEPWTVKEGAITPPIAISVFVGLMVCAWYTDAIGIYSVFGAFVFGAFMPRGMLATKLQEQLEHVTGCLLLPIFFVYSGLNTRIDLITGPGLLGVTLLLVSLSIVGKFVGCLLAAKATGETWRNSAVVGVLMNARGLMELIILNIGLQQKVITPQLFTIMVIMAIVTTLMASPIFKKIYRRPPDAPPSNFPTEEHVPALI